MKRVGFKDTTKEYAAKRVNKYEDQKVHSTEFRDKKYEGYSIGSPIKEQIIKGKTKGVQKDKKLDEEFIQNLHQHIYYLEMQLKLL